MENSSHSSAPTTNTTKTTSTSTTTTNPNPNTGSGNTSTGAVQNTLRMLNKSSHKISKPITKRHLPITSINPNPTTAPPPEAATFPSTATNQPAPPQPQPPVYNINKNDFRDVVQKLTGSPAHLNPPRMPSPLVSSPTPPPPTRPATSRLHKIRPPPLAHLAPRPDPAGATGGVGGNMWMRPSMTTPNSPLPAFPTVCAAAESPITAYMRCLHGGGGGGPQQQQSLMIPSSPGSMGAPLFPLPTSPLGFGCIPSPRSACQMLLPPSPRLPMPSPKCKDQ